MVASLNEVGMRRLTLDGWYAQTYRSQQLEMKGEEDAQVSRTMDCIEAFVVLS